MSKLGCLINCLLVVLGYVVTHLLRQQGIHLILAASAGAAVTIVCWFIIAGANRHAS